jgi:DNA-binding MurR/RpiR family transcriptional regulator
LRANAIAPTCRQELVARLVELQPLPAQLTLLAEFALKDPHTMAFASSADIAHSAGVSASTVTRLASVLGYSGLRDFRNIFRSELTGAANRRLPKSMISVNISHTEG